MLKGEMNKKDTIELIANIAIQLVFGLLGGAVAYAICGHTYHFKVSDPYHEGQAFFGELLYTAILVGTGLTIGHTSDTNLVAGGGVIASIVVGAYAVGPISGAALNPAVALGVSLIDVIRTGADFH